MRKLLIATIICKSFKLGEDLIGSINKTTDFGLKRWNPSSFVNIRHRSTTYGPLIDFFNLTIQILQLVINLLSGRKNERRLTCPYGTRFCKLDSWVCRFVPLGCITWGHRVSCRYLYSHPPSMLPMVLPPLGMIRGPPNGVPRFFFS